MQRSSDAPGGQSELMEEESGRPADQAIICGGDRMPTYAFLANTKPAKNDLNQTKQRVATTFVAAFKSAGKEKR